MNALETSSLAIDMPRDYARRRVASIGGNIKTLREARKIKQEDFAAKIGMRQSQLSGIENDRYGLPETPTLLKIAKGLDASVDDILQGIDLDYEKTRQRRIGESFFRFLREHKTLLSRMEQAARDGDLNDQAFRILREYLIRDLATDVQLDDDSEHEPQTLVSAEAREVARAFDRATDEEKRLTRSALNLPSIASAPPQSRPSQGHDVRAPRAAGHGRSGKSHGQK